MLRLYKNDGIADMLTLSELGALVGEYIAMLDQSLKLYCRCRTDLLDAEGAVDECYRAYLSHVGILL